MKLLRNTIFTISCIMLPASMASAEQSKWDAAKQEMSEAMKAISEYSAEKKDVAVDESRKVLQSLDQRMDELENQLHDSWDGMQESARADAKETIRSLRQQRTQLAEWYGALKHSSGDAWQDVKKGFVGAYESLANGFDEAESEYN